MNPERKFNTFFLSYSLLRISLFLSLGKYPFHFGFHLGIHTRAHTHIYFGFQLSVFIYCFLLLLEFGIELVSCINVSWVKIDS